MLVLFSASARNIHNDIELYRRIINIIRSNGHSISHDWIETAWLMTQRSENTVKDMHSIVVEANAGIEAAEVIIVEASDVSTFGVGYETSLALQRGKPVLALVREDAAARSYVAALGHDLLTVKEYSLDTLDEIVEEFLSANNVKNKELRFNFVMDRQIYNYIRAKSFKMHKTKAEIIRELLLRDMKED